MYWPAIVLSHYCSLREANLASSQHHWSPAVGVVQTKDRERVCQPNEHEIIDRISALSSRSVNTTEPVCNNILYNQHLQAATKTPSPRRQDVTERRAESVLPAISKTAYVNFVFRFRLPESQGNPTRSLIKPYLDLLVFA